MSSFSQWRTSQKKNSAPRQVTWLCGPEVVLVEEILSSIVESLAPAEWNYTSLIAGDDPERVIWSEVNQHPVDKSPRLVVVRNVERLKTPERLIDFLRERTSNPLTHLVFISGEEKAPRIEPTEEEAKRGATAVLVPYLAAIGQKGYLIECKPFTQATAKHAVAWVQDKVKMRDGIAGHLLNRSNGDLLLVRDTCRKLAVFPSEVSISTVNAMLAEQPRDSFHDALLALDRKTALLALREIPVAEYGRVIGLLDSRLDLAGKVHDMQLKHLTPGEMSRVLGNQGFLIKDILPVAKHYDLKRRVAIRNLLAIADEAVRAGATVGPLEAVVNLW